MDLVNQIKVLGDTIPEAIAVENLLRRLGLKFNHVVTMDEVNGSHMAHDARLKSQAHEHVEKEVKALHIKGETSGLKDNDKHSFRGRGEIYLRA